jgi:predicted ArsR family transcriptional regulator
VPPREYELAARLLAVAVESDTSGQSRTALCDAARQHGGNLAARALETEVTEPAGLAVQTALRQHGFEPWRSADGVVQLRNCPFHQLAALHPDMVCGMNLALIDGLVEGLGATRLRAVLDPQPGRCCVVIIDDSQPADVLTAETTTGES